MTAVRLRVWETRPSGCLQTIVPIPRIRIDLQREACAAPVDGCSMPIFEYECLECEQQFEHLQRAGNSPAACPSCGADHVRRLVSLCAVSSESRRAANLSAAHHRAATRRQEKQRSEHTEHHDHFGDAAHK